MRPNGGEFSCLMGTDSETIISPIPLQPNFSAWVAIGGKLTGRAKS
jgi:hypothetical protein